LRTKYIIVMNTDKISAFSINNILFFVIFIF
jgi:hypothetical protein